MALTVCDRLVDPKLPSDAEQFTPPPVYSTWWAMTEACSGKTGSLAAVTWVKTGEILHDPRNGSTIIGYWSAASNRIVMVNTAVMSGGAVRHEMLHALVRQPGHSREQFLGKCLGTVDCQESCITDAGPYPPPPELPIPVPGSSIDIAMDVEPRNPTVADDGGFFSITVSATNKSARWATVIPGQPGLNVTHTFSFDVRGLTSVSNSEVALDPSQTIFAPGETKKLVFDFSIGDAPFSRQLLPGNYTVRGGYADYWSTDSSFVIGP
jgi:hypothetical protein